jgi:putative intracellular protease/amidase
MSKKALLVVTSSNDSGCGGAAHGGFWLGELVHPYTRFVKAGYTVTICSIEGGKCHACAASLEGMDEECSEFWTHSQGLVANTKPLSSFNGKDFDLVFFVGGFGTMDDFPTSDAVKKIGAEVYENGGNLAAVCHGPIALVNIKLSDGEYLVKGKTVTAFTNEEEAGAGNIALPQGTCENLLQERGATFNKGAPWGSNTCASDRVFTGQNPASAGPLAELIIKSL